MKDCIIETENLTKKYGNQSSVSNLNIHVRQGRIYGLLGRNGAGKTTTMKMLLGLTTPTSGKIKIFGKNIRENENKGYRIRFFESDSYTSNSITSLPASIKCKI